MEIEKIPELKCNRCKGIYVIVTKNGLECDDCNRITRETSEDLKSKIRIELEKEINGFI